AWGSVALSSGESVNFSTMKGVLIAGIILALAVAAEVRDAESLSCVQCHSWENTCVNVTATECPSDANTSCVGSSASSSLGGNTQLYQDMFCSAENCSGETNMTFTVYVSSESFMFASQCCQGQGCSSTSDDLDTASDRLVLRGCSHISGSTCQFLSVGNQTVGGVIFREFQCVDGTLTSASPPTAGTGSGATLSTSQATAGTASRDPLTTSQATVGTGSGALLPSVALTTLLLLGLLL
ncbi:ly6/PLAUR domain-containing protein 8, partial [Otolemur garnettii]|uniref:ly6/PLAUR domain-containing protein 8 n=1 Tax=Otolemur garnettii TaxID=30611 RepID=UPI0006445BCE